MLKILTLNKTPSFAATAAEITTTIGTQSTNAHGHEITRTAIAYLKAAIAASLELSFLTKTPTNTHTTNTKTPMTRMTGAR